MNFKHDFKTSFLYIEVGAALFGVLSSSKADKIKGGKGVGTRKTFLDKMQLD